LEKYIQIQHDFDSKVKEQKKITLSDEELFLNTLIALDVELSEFANEGRWFKIWSNNQDPNKKMWVGVDRPQNLLGGFDLRFDGTDQYANPLLEEFADGVSFFLSLANQKGWQEHLYLHPEAMDELQEAGFHGGLNGAFAEIKFNLMKIALTKNVKLENTPWQTEHEFSFKNAWFVFMAMGMIGFGFEDEEIFQAYEDKNKKNYARLAEGY